MPKSVPPNLLFTAKVSIRETAPGDGEGGGGVQVQSSVGGANLFIGNQLRRL